MKGIIKLVPIIEPVEGMQVYFLFGKFPSIGYLYHDIKYGMWEIIVKPRDSKDFILQFPLSELSQMVIEYKECCSEPADQTCKGAHAICLPFEKTLPLHPSDWQEALGKIGQTVEFEVSGIYKGESIARLIPSPVIMYDEKEVKRLLEAYSADYQFSRLKKESFLIDDWWNNNKKKS